MRRAGLAIVSTIAALVMLLSFKSHSSTATSTPAAAIATPAQTAPSSSSPSPSASSGTRTVTGDAYDTRYGTVQVQITVTGGKLTDVTAVQLPSNNQRDIDIDNSAVPTLRQEALSAQSAQIDMVSGATYTSEGYIQSLQSALDKAKA